jgi:hypothetical protein
MKYGVCGDFVHPEADIGELAQWRLARRVAYQVAKT